jgi:hypothetical protein
MKSISSALDFVNAHLYSDLIEDEESLWVDFENEAPGESFFGTWGNTMTNGIFKGDEFIMGIY